MTSPIPAQYPSLQIPASIDYTSKDFTTLAASMLTYAGQAMPDWNTTSEGDFGVMMVELMAYMGDILSYYGDRITQEAYLPTATQRLSLLNIATTLGYVPSASIPSSGVLTFQTDATGPAVTIPALTQVVASVTPAGQSGPPVFETQSAIVVPPNGGTMSVEIVQGYTETFVQIGTSDGTPSQAFALPQLGVIEYSVAVYVESPDTVSAPNEWSQVDFMIDAQPDDQVFAIASDQNGVTYLVFGDNQNGMIPGINLNIWASYRVGVGSAGNLPAGSVNAMVQTIPGVGIALLDDGVTPICSLMGGGADAESNDSIRQNTSLAFSTQYRAISPQDYTNLAYNVPGVLMANAVFGNANSVTLYVLGPNYAAPGPLLVDNILDYFTPLAAGGVTLSVADPNIVSVDIGAPIAPSLLNPTGGTASPAVQLQVKPKFSQAVVTANVIAALQALLSPPNVSFGQLLNVSDIFEAIVAVAGVAYVSIPVFTREDVAQTGTTSIQFRQSEVPMIGTINIQASGGI